MSKKHLATVLWLIVATLTFALGWALRPDPERPDSSATHEAFLVGKAFPVSSDPDSEKESTEAEGTESADGDPATQSFQLGTRRVLSADDIKRLGEQLNSSLDPIARRLAFAQLLEGLTVDNAEEIRAQIEHLHPQSPEFLEFHYAWGKIGGLEAVMHGADTEKPDMAATLAGWASADPDAAIQWLEGLDMKNDRRFDILLKDRGIPEEKMRGSLVDGLVRGLANRDPDMATAFVFKLAAAGDPQAQGLFGIVTGNVLRANGPVEAAQWAANLPAGDMRTSAMNRVAHAYAQRDPEAAAAWALQLHGDEASGRVVSAISAEWSRRDGEAAVGWLNSLGDSPGRTEAYRAAFEGWADRNPLAASEYLAEMPSSPARDQAISGLVNRHRWEDPLASIVWAESITSERARLDALTRVGQAWTRRDPAAAAQWAATSGLPANLQQAIINPPRDRK